MSYQYIDWFDRPRRLSILTEYVSIKKNKMAPRDRDPDDFVNHPSWLLDEEGEDEENEDQNVVNTGERSVKEWFC